MSENDFEPSVSFPPGQARTDALANEKSHVNS